MYLNYKFLLMPEIWFTKTPTPYLRELLKRSPIIIEKKLQPFITAFIKGQSQWNAGAVKSINVILANIDALLCPDKQYLYVKMIQTIPLLIRECAEKDSTVDSYIFKKMLNKALKVLTDSLLDITIEKSSLDIEDVLLEELTFTHPEKTYAIILAKKISDFKKKEESKVNCKFNYESLILEIPDKVFSEMLHYCRKWYEECTKCLFSIHSIAQTICLNGLSTKLSALLNLGYDLVKSGKLDVSIMKRFLLWSMQNTSASSQIQKIQSLNSKLTDTANLYTTIGKQTNLIDSIPFFITENKKHQEFLQLFQKNKAKAFGPLSLRKIYPRHCPPHLKSSLSLDFPMEEEPSKSKKDKKPRIPRPHINHPLLLISQKLDWQKSTKKKRDKEIDKNFEQFLIKPKNPIKARVIFSTLSKSTYWNFESQRSYADVLKKSLEFFEKLTQESLELDEKEEKQFFEFISRGLIGDFDQIEPVLDRCLAHLKNTNHQIYISFIFNLLLQIFETKWHKISGIRLAQIHELLKEPIQKVISILDNFETPNDDLEIDLYDVSNLIHYAINFKHTALSLSISRFILKLLKTQKTFKFPKNFLTSLILEEVKKKSVKTIKEFWKLDNKIEMTWPMWEYYMEICEALPDLNFLIEPISLANFTNIDFQIELFDTKAKGTELESVDKYLKEEKNVKTFNHIKNKLAYWIWTLKGLAPMQGMKSYWIAILTRQYKLLELYYRNSKVDDLDIRIAFLRKDIKALQIIFRRRYGENLYEYFRFIDENNYFWETIKQGNEEFAIQIMKKFVEVDQYCVLGDEFFGRTDEFGRTVFHYIAIFRMSKLFYRLVKYFYVANCKSDVALMIQKLSVQFTLKFDRKEEVKALDLKEYKHALQWIDLDLTVIETAFYSRFYELLVFTQEYKLLSGKVDTFPEVEPEKLGSQCQSRFRFLDKIPIPGGNEVNTLYIILVTLYNEIVATIKASKVFSTKKLPINWKEIVENICFNGALLQNGELIAIQGINKWKELSLLGLDILVIEMYPELIISRLQTEDLFKVHFSWLLKCMELLANQEYFGENNSILKNVYTNYKQELFNKNARKLDLNNEVSILWQNEKIRELISGYRKVTATQKIEENLQNCILDRAIPETKIPDLASKYSQQGWTYPLKFLTLAYPEIFFEVPNISEEYEDKHNFWLTFNTSPKAMCELLSSFNSKQLTEIVFHWFNLREDNFSKQLTEIVFPKVEPMIEFCKANKFEPGYTTRIVNIAYALAFIVFSCECPKSGLLDLICSLTKIVHILIETTSHIPEELLNYFRSLNNTLLPSEGNAELAQFLNDSSLEFAMIFHNRLQKPFDSNINIDKDHSESSKETLSVSEKDIAVQLQMCGELFIKNCQHENNSLIFYLKYIGMLLGFNKMLQEISHFAEDFNIVIYPNFQLIESGNPQISFFRHETDYNLEAYISYKMIFEENKISFRWEERDILEIEDSINKIFFLQSTESYFQEFLPYFLEDLKEALRSPHDPDAVGRPPISKLEIQIDFESFKKIPYESTIPITDSDISMDVFLVNQEANSKGMSLLHARMFGLRASIIEIDYLFSYEAINRNYAVEDADPKLPPLSIKYQGKQLILQEFYECILKEYGTIKISYLEPEEFEKLKEKTRKRDYVLQRLDFYEDIFQQISAKISENLEWAELIPRNFDWIFTYNDGKLENYTTLPHYYILKLRILMRRFENEVNSSITKGLKWKINIRSFLEEIAITSSNILKNTRNRNLKIFQETEEEDLISIMNYYLRNGGVLYKVLQILIQIFSQDLKELFKEFIGVYIVFSRAKKEEIDKSSMLDSQYLFGLDKVIRYAGIKYEKVGKMLIVKLCYFTAYESLDEIPKFEEVISNALDNIIECEPVEIYLSNIVNKFDIYFQLFEARDIINNIFQKHVSIIKLNM